LKSRKFEEFVRNKPKNFEKGIDKRRKRWYNIEVASEEPRKRLFRNEKIKKNSKNFEKALDKSF
jgi:hypothetical protein